MTNSKSAAPSFDKDSAATRLREAGKDLGFLDPVSRIDPWDDLASVGSELEENAPPFDSEASADDIRSTAHALGLLEVREDLRHRPTAVFGIDLGTSNSSIAYIDDAGVLTPIKSALGELAMPSVVYFESESFAVVGQEAKNHALLAPDLIAQGVKLAMGRMPSTRSTGTGILRSRSPRSSYGSWPGLPKRGPVRWSGTS